MIDVIIASYNEPKSTLKAVNAFLNQNIKQELRVIVIDPFPEIERFLKKNINDKRFNFILDTGEGKNEALSMVFQEYYSDSKEDFFILSDGDVYVSENSINEIMKKFKDSKVGFVSGKPVPVESRNVKYGYWANLLFSGIDKVRKKMSQKEKFFQGTGYLSAIRKGIISEVPLGAADDVLIPYLIWKKGHKIAYADKAEVYVKSPGNWGDWVKQKVRNIKGHENIKNITPDMPRTKSFFNEIKEGTIFALTYPENLMEFFWTLQLFPARLYIYIKAFREIAQKKRYIDGWREEEIKSTRMMD